MPLLSDLSEWRRRLDEIQQSVYTSTNDTDVVFIADFPGLPAVSININKWSNSFDKRPHRRVVTLRDDEWIRSTFTPITSHGSFGINKWSNSFDERPHRRVVTPRGGEWIRPTLTALIRGSFGPHESAVKRHLDRFSCFCRVHTCVEIANLSPLAAANGFVRPRPHTIHGSSSPLESAPNGSSIGSAVFAYTAQQGLPTLFHEPETPKIACLFSREISTPSNAWFLGQRKSAPKPHLDRLSRF